MILTVPAAVDASNREQLGLFLGQDETLRRLDAHVGAWFPREACALVFRADAGLTLELVENLADDFHAADPEAFPRSATTSFVLDARVIARSERDGRRLVAIVHSHPDGTVAFSGEDRRLASTPDRRFPLYPEVFHVVLGAAAGRIGALATYFWSAEAADFVHLDGCDARSFEIVR